MVGKHSPNLLDKSVKRKIFGPRIDEVIEKCVNLHKEVIYCVYPQQILLW